MKEFFSNPFRLRKPKKSEGNTALEALRKNPQIYGYPPPLYNPSSDPDRFRLEGIIRTSGVLRGSGVIGIKSEGGFCIVVDLDKLNRQESGAVIAKGWVPRGL